MPENLIERKKVSFSDYLDKNGAIVHIVGASLHGEIVYQGREENISFS